MSHSSHRAAPARLDERRRMTRRNWMLATVGVASGSGALLLACGGGGGGGGSMASAGGAASAGAAGAGGASGMPSDPAPAPPAPASASSAPALGSHGLVFDRIGDSRPALSVSGVSARAGASTLLACVGRGQLSADAAPMDSAGNAYVQLGAPHAYTLWPNSGTVLYACAQASRGMEGAAVTVPKPNQGDEVTLSVVEVANGGLVRDVQWTEVLAGQALTSATVSTSGPALLVAWWWGDADVEGDKTAVPDNGFTVVDSVMAAGALVQCAVAVRQVEAAGSYNVTWTSTPRQGAQLWIAAVQAAAS